MNSKIGIFKVLTAVQTLGAVTNAQLAESWGENVKKAQTYVDRYRWLGYLERVNPGRNPAIHQLSEKGREVLAPKPAPRRRITDEMGIVEHARRTQPISVFDLKRTAGQWI